MLRSQLNLRRTQVSKVSLLRCYSKVSVLLGGEQVGIKGRQRPDKIKDSQEKQIRNRIIGYRIRRTSGRIVDWFLENTSKPKVNSSHLNQKTYLLLLPETRSNQCDLPLKNVSATSPIHNLFVLKSVSYTFSSTILLRLTHSHLIGVLTV